MGLIAKFFKIGSRREEPELDFQDPAWRCPCGSTTEDLEVMAAAIFIRERNGSVRLTIHVRCLKCKDSRKVRLADFDALRFFKEITETMRFQIGLLKLTTKHGGSSSCRKKR